MSYLFGISFPRKVFTALEPRWVEFCIPWQLASGVSLLMSGCRSTCQLVASPSQHRVCGFCLYSFLTPCAQPFQANQAWTQGSWWAWFQFLFQSQMNSQGHSFFGYSVCCYLKMSSLSLYRHAFLTSFPSSRESAVPAWSTQLGKWTSRP